MSHPETYQFGLVVKNDDYIVRDHQLHGVRLVPGVTFLDLIYRFLDSKGFQLGQIEVKNVIFKEPVATSPQFARKVQVTIERGPSVWTVRAKSQKVAGGQVVSPDWTEHFQAELNPNSAPLRKQIEIERLKQQAFRVDDMDHSYVYSRKSGLQHYEFMKLLGRIHQGDGYLLAEVHLSRLAQAYLNQFLFHPAYLDGSLSVPGILIFHSREVDYSQAKPLIPLYIGSFRAADRFREKCFVYVQNRNIQISASQDIAYSDIEIYNEQGQILAAYQRFGVKKVRTAESIIKLETLPAAAPGRPEPAQGDRSAPIPGGWLKEEGLRSTETLTAELRQMIGGMLGKVVEQAAAEVDFYDLGLDSGQLLRLVRDLEEKLGVQLYPTLLFEYPNINQLAEYLLAELTGTNTPANQGDRPDAPDASVAISRNDQARELQSRELSESVSDFCYVPKWVPGPAVAVPAPADSTASDPAGTILIFSPWQCYGLDQELAGFHCRDQVHLIKLGRGNKTISASQREIKLDAPKAWDNVIESFPTITGIYFLGGIQTGDPDPDDPKALNRSQEQGVYSLYRLLKSLSQAKRLPSLQWLKVITNKVYQVKDGERTRPYAASVHGLTTVAAKEYPKVALSYLDIGWDNSDPDAAAKQRLIEAIVAEPRIKAGEPAAYRDGERYLRVNEPVWLPSGGPSLLKSRGVYLIVGGAGGIGLELAKFLAAEWMARLVLVGRGELNSGQQTQIAAIEAGGGQVVYLRADATDYESMKTAIAEAKSRFGKINGVIHSAVVLRDKVLEKMDEASFREALAPKVQGSVALYRAVREEPLDFMMFFSSTVALDGNTGQSNYTAGCTFKDAFAVYLGSQKSFPVKIINWGYWGSVGVAATPAQNRRMAESGLLSIEPAEGMEVIRRTLSNYTSQVIAVKLQESLLQKLRPERSHLRDRQFRGGQTARVREVPAGPAIEVLADSWENAAGSFQNYWSDLRQSKVAPPFPTLDAVHEYLRLIRRDAGRIQHLRVTAGAEGKKMEVVTAGNGRPVLLITGFALTAPQWYYQFKEWVAQYQLIVVHVPGSGLSEAVSDLSFTGLGKVIIEVLQELKVEWPIHVVGTSWGGMLAQSLANQYPERLASLTLACSFTRLNFEDSRDSSIRERLKRDFEQQPGQEQGYQLLLKSEHINPAVAVKYADFTSGGFDTFHLLAGISTPTLVVAGRKDRTIDPEESRILHAHIRNSEYFEIPEAGHAPYITHYREFNQRVSEFIAQQETRRAKKIQNEKE
jgi:pimeloyl-ACP methyl ester carboxylesterase/NADP-dependent 3-hydroxy acid dehydrogenase YdfG/acyl carrier protein